jgi:methylmalonyl-CoA mutase
MGNVTWQALHRRDAGVQGNYGPGSNIVECAADVFRLLGHNMPPVGG